MDPQQLRQQIATLRQAFFDEGILDQQFIVVENLEKEGYLDSIEDLSNIYYRDANKWLNTIEKKLQKTPSDYETMEMRLHQLKGSSASLGAIRVKNAVTQAQTLLCQGNVEGFKGSLQEVKRECEILKTKFDAYFHLVNQLE